MKLPVTFAFLMSRAALDYRTGLPVRRRRRSAYLLNLR